VGFKDYEVQRVQRALDWMRQPQDDTEIKASRADFYHFFNEHDQRRGTWFLNTFPEMMSFYSECEHHAKTQSSA